jgi:hypothetical protein
MLDESPLNGSSNAIPAAKIATMPHTTSVPVTGKQTDQATIEEMAGKWSDFKFAPIREVRHSLLLSDFHDLGILSERSQGSSMGC